MCCSDLRSDGAELYDEELNPEPALSSVFREVAEQACRERDKVKADLERADRRNLQLVREVDDRHASMETLNQSRIR